MRLMRLAWTLALCILVVGSAAAVAAASGWFGGGSDNSTKLEAAAVPGRASYYVDASRGRNSNAGTSPEQPWKTLSPLARRPLRGGDAVLLRGGQRFRGSIRLATGNLSATSPTSMLQIGSYGGGRATLIARARHDAISATDVAGIRVSGVDLVGTRPSCRVDAKTGYRYGAAGIGVEAVSPGLELAQGIDIDHVDVSGFCNGIAVGSQGKGSRISHLRVTAVKAHDNANAGIWTLDLPIRQHSIRDVRVSSSSAYRNGGLGGIVLFGVDGGTVESSVAFANARAAEGGVGIWTFDSNRILFTHNESYRNGGPTVHYDGDGFDFDRGVSNSVMVHNYSHDNGGAGFLVCSCNSSDYPYYRMHNNVIRSNISRNDGTSGQPSLIVGGGELMTGVAIASNRVESTAGHAPLVVITGCLQCDRAWRAAYVANVPSGEPYTQVRLTGNTFIAAPSKPLRKIQPGPRADLVLGDNHWRTIRAP
jgi:parallel beta helix pectate lyase-like protein